jgi:hypothetical protein
MSRQVLSTTLINIIYFKLLSKCIYIARCKKKATVLGIRVRALNLRKTAFIRLLKHIAYNMVPFIKGKH